jgi:hypothetical protein
MKLSNHDKEEDFPLSGGKEPQMYFSKWALIGYVALMVLIALLTMKSKGYF